MKSIQHHTLVLIRGNIINLLSSAGLRGPSDASAEKAVAALSDLVRSTQGHVQIQARMMMIMRLQERYVLYAALQVSLYEQQWGTA